MSNHKQNNTEELYMYKNVVLTMANQLIESIPVEALSVYYNNKVWDINPKRKAYCLARIS